MSSNSEILRKADLAIGDLASGGLLNPEQSDSFIRNLIAQPTLLSQARVVSMNSPQRTINKIGFGSRIMRAATSATALSAGDRSAPDLGKISLATKEVIAEIRLPYDVIEDNVERGNLNMAGANSDPQAVTGGIKDTIMALIAERAALDLEELGLLGDTASLDAYLALTDGFLKRTTSNVVDNAAATISKDMFKAGLKTLPDAYLRNRPAMRHFVSVDNEIEYRDTLAARETNLGDAAIQARNPVFGFGVPIEAVSLMPAAQGLFTNPLNLIMGIQRQVSIEVDKIITDRVFVIVLTARVDFQVEEELAAVKYINIG
jgi:hypothetical protein